MHILGLFGMAFPFRLSLIPLSHYGSSPGYYKVYLLSCKEYFLEAIPKPQFIVKYKLIYGIWTLQTNNGTGLPNTFRSPTWKVRQAAAGRQSNQSLCKSEICKCSDT